MFVPVTLFFPRIHPPCLWLYPVSQITVREYRRYHLGNGAHILLKGTTIEVTLGRAGVKVLWDGWSTVSVTTTKPSISTCGLCGNNNGNSNDELINNWFVGPHMIRKCLGAKSEFIKLQKTWLWELCRISRLWSSHHCTLQVIQVCLLTAGQLTTTRHVPHTPQYGMTTNPA